MNTGEIDQRRRNVWNIIEKANAILDREKAEAVRQGDFDKSLQIARNQADIECYARESVGANPVKMKGETFVVLDSNV